MNLASLFHGTLGSITIAWVVFIVLLFFYAILRALKKTDIVIKDCEALSFPTTEDELNKTHVGKLLLENGLEQTSDYVEDTVNTQSVAAEYKLNVRLMQAVPSILTSLGILGTFVGLSIAVLKFDTSSSESIRDSIETLLAGMGTAFFTSVAGMSVSVLYLWFERSRYNHLCNSIDALCGRINKQYHRPSGALLDAGLEKISGKIDGLQFTFGDNLDKIFDEKVTPVMSEISRKLENPAQTVVDGLINEFKKLSDGFADRLTEKVNTKMNELLEQFILATDEMKGIPGAINTATDNLLKSGETTIETQKAYTKETKERFDKYTEDLTNAVKGQLSEIHKQFTSASGALKGIPEEITHSVEAQKSVTENFTQQIARLSTIEEIYSAAIEKITTANKDLADAKSNINALTSRIGEASKSIESASSGMVESNKKMLSDFEAIYELNRDVTSQVKDYSERVSGIEKGLKGIFGEIEKGLTNYATTSSKNMQGMLDVFTGAVTKASQEISNSTTPLHEAISGILNALDKTERSARSLLERVEKLPQQKANQ